MSLLDWLLHHGWVTLEEQRQSASWRPLWVQFRELPALRRVLGLKDADAEVARWAHLRTELATELDPALAPFMAALDELPPARALARADLVSALTPATLAAAITAENAPQHWQLVENRTSFERVARNRAPDTGVIWLPVFPPAWWREAVAKLLALTPAPAAIACDPAPAGVAIALQAGALWQAAGLDWQPWHMDAATLQRLPHRSPLNAWDQMRIAQLAQDALPDSLSALLAYMSAHNVKGEQEGIGTRLRGVDAER